MLIKMCVAVVIASIVLKCSHSHGGFRRQQQSRRSNKEFRRVQGGVDFDSIMNFPYMTSIHIAGNLWCGGAIVDTRWVLTAAHCTNYVLYASPVRNISHILRVRVGSHNSTEGGIEMGVLRVVRHPRFEEDPPPHYDVALLMLEQQLSFNENINLIKIYGGDREPLPQSFVTVNGWGATSYSENQFVDPLPNLLHARLKVRPHDYCVESYSKVTGLDFNHEFFCASLRNGLEDVCLFDAGIPAIQDNAMVGILTFGPERCGVKQPAVFIRSAYFKDFVRFTLSLHHSERDIIKVFVSDQKAEDDARGLNEEGEKEVHEEPA